VNLYTIGFTKKSAERFFALLRDAGVQRLIDIRLNPHGQLSGFAKQEDLAWFLAQLIDAEYVHVPILAPTPEILTGYRADHKWDRYVTRFEALMDERGVPSTLDKALFTDGGPSCLLCSEATPEKCHRRLVGDRLVNAWPNISLVHLV
jgi:uncharacterized protein (DUF488 family)